MRSTMASFSTSIELATAASRLPRPVRRRRLLPALDDPRPSTAEGHPERCWGSLAPRCRCRAQRRQRRAHDPRRRRAGSLPEMLLPAAVRIEPETLNLGSEAGDGTVSIFLSLPLPHQASEIIPSSVELCLVQRCVSGDGSWNLAGNSTLQSKFDREGVRGLLQGAHGWVTLDAHGDLSVPPGHFQGSDAVAVLD